MQPVSVDRLLSLTAFEGLKTIRSYQDKHPDVDPLELFDIIAKVDSDGPTIDFEASSHLGLLVGADCPDDQLEFYQTCIKVVVLTRRPGWVAAMRTGRTRFINSLEQDDRDVFEGAGLMENPPSMGTVNWWDDVVGNVNLQIVNEKMQQARKAESLTIDHEIEELKKKGIDKVPEWTGLDDNFAGYDVLSYEPGENGPVQKMIEVKSTTASPLRFILTRNEWNKANKVGEAYIFHVWDMQKDPALLYIRTVEQVRPHIPDDNEKGKWKNVEIPLGI